MIERIFTATNDLMATVGLPNLSMHKIAKEAKISPGTIYIYFKNKDELLAQFARYIFKSFQETLGKDYDESQSFFHRYRQMWWNIWYFMKFAKSGSTKAFGMIFVQKPQRRMRSVICRLTYCLPSRWKARSILHLNANNLLNGFQWICWSRLSNVLGVPFKNNNFSYR